VNYCNPEVDQLIEQGTYSRDPEERAQLIRRAQEIIVGEAPGRSSTSRIGLSPRANVSGIALFNDLTLRYAYLGKTGSDF
jgi:hypothetical protein